MGRDESFLEGNIEQIRGTFQHWIPNSAKYLDLYKSDQYKTTLIQEDWRPIISEQIQAKKIIFTLDDKYVAYDIRGDNKLIIFEWNDMPNLVDQKQILKEIKNFKEKNLMVIDGLKSKLVREKLYTNDEQKKKGNFK